MRLLTTLLHPRRSLVALQASDLWPWAQWIPLGCLAIGGSCLYGASLALQMPWSLRGAALWLTLASGLGWFALGPALRLATGLPWRLLAHACLVTMAYGEGVLIFGALLNATVIWSAPRAANGALVLASNVVMGAALAAQLRALGVPWRRSLACWVVALDGTGACFFLLLRFLLAR